MLDTQYGLTISLEKSFHWVPVSNLSPQISQEERSAGLLYLSTPFIQPPLHPQDCFSLFPPLLVLLLTSQASFTLSLCADSDPGTGQTNPPFPALFPLKAQLLHSDRTSFPWEAWLQPLEQTHPRKRGKSELTDADSERLRVPAGHWGLP